MPVPVPNYFRPEVKITCDASKSGWGTHMTWPNGSKSFFQGTWDDLWCSEHINLKELKAVILALSLAGDSLKQHMVSVFSDNKATVFWLNRGSSSRSEKARDILLHFANLKFSLGFDLKAFYIRGQNNLLADSLSRSLIFDSELEFKASAFVNLCKLLNFKPQVLLCSARSFSCGCQCFESFMGWL